MENLIFPIFLRENSIFAEIHTFYGKIPIVLPIGKGANSFVRESVSDSFTTWLPSSINVCCGCQRNSLFSTFLRYSMLPSIRPLKTKTQFLRRLFQFAVNEVFRMKTEHFSFKMKALASLQPVKQLQRAPFYSGE